MIRAVSDVVANGSLHGASGAVRDGRLVGSILRRRRRDVVVGTVGTMAHQASEAAVPVVIGLAIDRAVVTGDGAAMLRWAGVLAGVFAVLTLAGLIAYFTLDRARIWIAHDARLAVVDRVLDPRGGVSTRSGDVVSLASDDADRIGDVSFAIGLGVGALPPLIGGSAFLLAVSVPLGLVVVIGVPVVVGLIALLSRPLVGRSEQEQEAVAAAAGVATDLLRGLRVLKGLGVGDEASARYRIASRRALDARLRAARFFAGYDGVTLAVSGSLLVIVAWVGGRLALDGDITVGQLVIAVGLAQFLIGPLWMLIGAGESAASVRAASRRIRALQAQPLAVDDDGDDAPRAPVAGAPVLALNSVDHGPLRQLTFDVNDGSMLGVVAAPTDAAALVDLLARRVDPQRGRVLVQGNDVRSLPIDHVRTHVLVSDVDAMLFDDTTIGQIALHAADAVATEAALSASTADDVMAAIPDGRDTPIGEGGRQLSGGQRQRLVLARALAAAPTALVLHDPLTAVDATTEHVIAERLRQLRQHTTATVAVTTSPALLAVCDEVIVIEDGHVVRRSTHDDLIADPTYAELVLQ